MVVGRVIGWAFAALSVAVAGCSDAVSGSATQSTVPDALVGVWRSQVQFGGGSLSDLHDLEFMLAVNLGGTLTQSSNYDGTPPVPPAYGLWKQTGPRSYELRYSFYSPPKFVKSGRASAWVPSGRGLYVEKLDLSVDGNTYRSHVVYDFVDPAGHAVPGGGEGEATGTRARLEFAP
jgi:hypothetical protein